MTMIRKAVANSGGGLDQTMLRRGIDKIHEQGRQAFRDGKMAQECPYQPDPMGLWFNGWMLEKNWPQPEITE